MSMPSLPAAGNTSWRDTWAQAVHDAATEVTTGRLTSTNLAEYIRDTMGTALVAGTGVTKTVNDVGDTITIAASGGAGGVNVKSYGAVGDGVTDDSAAFAAAATAAKAGLTTMVPTGLQTEKRGTVAIDVPPGNYLITNPGAFLGDEAMAENGVGLTWRGAGKSISTIIFKPTTAGVMVTNDYWMGLQFSDLRFIAGTAGCTFMLSNTTHAAQAYTFQNVAWWNFKYAFNIQGTNNNSEYLFVGCDTAGIETAGAFLYIGTTNTVDQFLNYWFFGFKHWSTSAPLIDASAGGHFHLDAVDASNWGSALTSPGYLFNLRGASHADGVCSLRVNGLRVEAMDADAGLLYSEWPAGNVTFRSVDWSSQVAFVTYGDIIYLNYLNVSGPDYAFYDSHLAGGVKVKVAVNAYEHLHAVSFTNCDWRQKHSPSDVVTYDTTGNSLPLVVPPVEFIRCRGDGQNVFATLGASVWDARIGWRGELVQTLKPRVLSVRDTQGHPNGATSYYVTLPIGAYITGLQAMSPAGTTAEADGGAWTLATTEGTPTTVATVTVATALSAGYDQTTALTLPFSCSTAAKATLKITATNVSSQNPGGLLLIKGYW